MLDIRYFNAVDSLKYTPVARLPIQIKQLFKEYPIGGVILFRENLTNITNIVKLTRELQVNTKFGRLIGLDQEGGIITRIAEATDTPGNMALGAINNTQITAKVASLIGRELKALGINLNFAPCLDVNSNPNNPVIGLRSFGSNPNLVSTHGCAFSNGLKEQQIISCVKHFPGHGDVSTDTHFAATYVNRSAVEIEKCDLLPFQESINNGVDMVMTAHIIVPRLDNSQLYSNINEVLVDTPATLSQTIISKILRKQMGFNGVIASDALDMEAITNNFDAVDATILALTAGVDLIMMPIRIWNEYGIQEFIKYFDCIHNICSASSELKDRVRESCYRILRLKAKYNIGNTNLDSKRQILAARKIVGGSKHRQFEQSTAAAAITLYRNVKKVLPWKSSPQDNIFIISKSPTLAEDAQQALANLGFSNGTISIFNDEQPLDDLIKQIQAADKVLVLTYNLNKTDANLDYIINRLNHFHKPYVMLSCRNPYDILYVKDVATNVLVFGVSGLDQTNNYQTRPFLLNLNQAIIKIFTATEEQDFNLHASIDLSIPPINVVKKS